MVWRNPAQPGSPTARNFLPWYEQTDFVCGNCQQGFRLDEADFVVGHGPFMGSALDQRLFWRKFATTTVAGVIDPATAGTDGFPNTYYPDQIYGPCPFCGFQNAYVAADYGAAHPADASGVTPTLIGLLQTYYSGGAVAVTFFNPGGGIVGVFLRATNAPYLLDASGLGALSLKRTAAAGIDAAGYYQLTTPAVKISPAEAARQDDGLCALVVRAGMAVI
jgi:hypothetical protein